MFKIFFNDLICVFTEIFSKAVIFLLFKILMLFKFKVFWLKNVAPQHYKFFTS